MMCTRRLTLVLAALLPAGLASPTPVSQQFKREVISGKYIITLREDVAVSDVSSHLNWVSDVHRRRLNKRTTVGIENTYNISTWNTYAGELDDETIQQVKDNPEVATVEEDTVMYLWSAGDSSISERALTTRGLETIANRNSGSTSHIYDTSAGANTYTYIVDGGVLTTHNQFGGRATLGYNVVGGSHVDTLGHGTNVAGTIGSADIHHQANLISVMVFSGAAGTTSTVLDNYNWAVNDITYTSRQTRCAINLSIGGPASSAWTSSVNAAYSSGALSVVAAGNGDENGNSPCFEPIAWECPECVDRAGVDTFASGVSVFSSYNGSNTATQSRNGTSMATPQLVIWSCSVSRGS
ncbi:alkaline proteinase [Seiridium cupressi]